MKFNSLRDRPIFSDECPDEPVLKEEARLYLKISVPDDDRLLDELIVTARQQCEDYLCIGLKERTVTARLQNDINNIELPYGPVFEMTELQDSKGDVIDTGEYNLKGLHFKKLDYCNCDITAIYKAGYSAEDLPRYFKTAILNQVAWLYEHRGDDTDGLSPQAINKLKPHRRVT